MDIPIQVTLKELLKKLDDKTLKEKIAEEYVYTIEPLLDSKDIRNSIDKIANVAEDFAVNFAEWYFAKCYLSNMDMHKTTKELLEIYKNTLI